MNWALHRVRFESIRQIAAAEQNGKIVAVWFVGKKGAPEADDFSAVCPNVDIKESKTAVLRKFFHELDDYFSGRPVRFSVPIDLCGTEFQKKVWKEMKKIPSGKVMTYGKLAAKVGSPGAAIAVGQACAKNPIPIIVPCHRVIGAGKRLVGFASGIEVKKALLDLEKAEI